MFNKFVMIATASLFAGTASAQSVTSGFISTGMFRVNTSGLTMTIND